MSYQKYTKTEQKFNRPMAEILLTYLNDIGEEKTAELLGVDQSTVWAWAKRAGVRFVSRWERVEGAEQERTA